MIPTVLSFRHPDTPSAVDAALETGRTLIFPTDTVYGIGGNPWDQRTLHHVRRLKERDPEQPFTLHLCHVSEIAGYTQCSPAQMRIVEQLLPGPYTLLLPAAATSPPATVHGKKIGIRVPDHPFFRDSLSRPVFGTSVNRRGMPPINDVAEIIETFTEVDLIISGDVPGVSSTILDLTERPVRLIRGTVPDSVRRILDQE
jgi:L-threonylcarbamoyladenylate synthase